MALRDLYPDEETRLDPSRRRAGLAFAPSRPGLFTILWRRKLLVLASLLLGLLGGAGYLAITPPRYMATAAMLIDPRLGKSVGSDPNTPGFIADNAAMDSQIKLFTSQTVLSRVATQLDLGNDPEFNGSQRSLLQKLLHSGQVLDKGIDLKALEDAITIKRPERTYIVEIDVLARDPKKAAQIANSLTQAYIDDQVSSRVGAARTDTQYVMEKLDALSTQIRKIDDRIETYKSQNRIIEANGLRSNEQQVTDLTKALGDARAKESDAKAKSAEINRFSREGRLDSSSEALKSLTMERLRQQQADTEQNVARLAKTLGDRHPEMIEAKERQTKVRALIRAELQRLRGSIQGDYRSAHQNERQIVAEVDRLRDQSNKISHALVPLDQLERDRTVLRSSFDKFSQANSSLAQQEAASPPGRVIAVARPSVSPTSPKKTVVGVASIAAGLFVGLASALFIEGTSSRSPVAPPFAFDEPEVPASRMRPRRRYWDDDDDDARV